MRNASFGFVLLLICATVCAQSAPSAPPAASDFLAPFPAHHVIGNIYFVGSKSVWASIWSQLPKDTS